MKKRRPTKAEREYMGWVADRGCIICRRPAEIHHIRAGVGAGQRSTAYETIGLCPKHHRLGGHGVAIHAGQETWQAIHGDETDLADRTFAAHKAAKEA